MYSKVFDCLLFDTVVVMDSYMSNTAFSKYHEIWGRNVISVPEKCMKKGNWPGWMTNEQPSPLTTRERWTIRATADSTQLDLESLCKPSSILYCRRATRVLINSCCLLPVSYSGVYFPLGYLACTSLSYQDFGMKHKAIMTSQRHNNSWRISTGDISVLQNFMG